MKRYTTIVTCLLLVFMLTSCAGSFIPNEEADATAGDTSLEYGDATSEYDPSDIYQFDFTGYWYEPTSAASDGNKIEDGSYSEYDLMVMNKTGDSTFDSFYFDPRHYQFTSESTGYYLDEYDGIAITIDIDRESRKLRIIESSGDIRETFDIEYCEETQEWYLRCELFDDEIYCHLDQDISGYE